METKQGLVSHFWHESSKLLYYYTRLTGSTDETAPESYSALATAGRLARQEGQGSASARTHGLAAALYPRRGAGICAYHGTMAVIMAQSWTNPSPSAQRTARRNRPLEEKLFWSPSPVGVLAFCLACETVRARAGSASIQFRLRLVSS